MKTTLFLILIVALVTADAAPQFLGPATPLGLIQQTVKQHEINTFNANAGLTANQAHERSAEQNIAGYKSTLLEAADAALNRVKRQSYGRKKRSTTTTTEQNIAGYKSTLLEAADAALNRVKRQADPSEVLVVQTLRIVDNNKKFKGGAPLRLSDNSIPTINNQTVRNTNYHNNVQETSMLPTHQKCVEENTLISGAVIFLVIQVIILSMFVFLWKKKRENHKNQTISPPESTTDSLSYMYESGFTRRLQ